MTDAGRDKALRIALVAVGVIFTFGIYPLTVIWPDGFMWEPRQAEYEMMIIVTIAILGVFLLMASRNPAAHRSLISFAGWMSLLHGLLMLWQALQDPTEHANLFGDVPALILVGVVLLVLNRPSGAGTAA